MHKRKLQSMKITALNFVSPYPIKLRDTQELLLGRVGKTQANSDCLDVNCIFFLLFDFVKTCLSLGRGIVYLQLSYLCYKSVTKKSMHLAEEKGTKL